MYTLHIANKNYSSWSLRPWVLMQALNIPFTEKLHPFPGTNTWEAYRHFSPSGKVPCLETNGIAVWDSLAIAEYLAEEHPSVWPKDKSARAWARCASAEMHSGFQAIRNYCSMCCGVRIQLTEQPASLQKDIARIDELWCEGLKRFGGPFLAGAQFTAVDAFFAPVVFRVQTYGLSLSKTARDYIERMLNVPAMKAWYEAALLETWREPHHEDEIMASGKLLNDFRATDKASG